MLAASALLAVTAAVAIVRADVTTSLPFAALPLRVARAAVAATVLLAQLLHAHLQSVAELRTIEHRPAQVAVASRALAWATLPATLPLALRRAFPALPLLLTALLPTALRLVAAHAFPIVLTVVPVQLLAAFLQALAHRLEALLRGLDSFA